MTQMSPAEAIFFAALERPPGEQAVFLDQACADDTGLRARIEKMLAAQSHLGRFLDQPQAQPPPTEQQLGPPDPPAEVPGAIIAGRYKLLQRIGEGGMGSVWMADQLAPVKRRVAVKLIHGDRGGSQTILARFEAERQAIALMDHPHIARLLDAGTTGPAEAPTMGAGRPYFVMELIKGIPLNEYCDQHKLSIEERLHLFMQICSAVQHAHQKGIIHRDLKPTNILVEAHDDRPVPKIIDFGLAKALSGQPLTERTLFTGFGTVAGTPLYMAPEQARFNAIDVDTRADIYALGVILYELLTGTTPIEREQLKTAAFDEILRVIRESEPLTPSKRLSSTATKPGVAANRQMEPLKLGRLLRGDLDWIVMKALAKERERRYETASGLARDIERFLNHEPVLAGPPSTAYRLRKLVRRHPLELALTGTVALLLFGCVSVVWWQNEQASVALQTDLRRQLADEQRSAADNARLARNAEAVAALLGQAEEALRAGDAAKAQVALDAATKRTAEGGAEKQAQRLGRLDADLALLRDLDAIDQFRWTPVENLFPDLAVVATRTRAALRRFGADPDAVSEDEAVARVSASVVRKRIVTALDRLLWPEKTSGVRAVLRLLWPEKPAGVWGVLRRVDADPYRDTVRDAVLARDREKILELAQQKAALEQPAGFAAILSEYEPIKVERRRELLRAAVSRRPGDLSLLMALGNSYPMGQKDGANDGLRWFQAAVAAAPTNPAALNKLGIALSGKGELEEAIACFRKTIEIDPKYTLAHNNLGVALYGKGRTEEAIACFRKAVAIDPKLAQAHRNLGGVLGDRGKVDEAIACFRKAIALDPGDATAHSNLGAALSHKGKVDEAIACWRKAIALDSRDPWVHNNLGTALRRKGKVDEAIACWRKAIALDLKDARVYTGLGAVLCDVKRDYDGAIACFRQAIDLEPTFAPAHFNLGIALQNKDQVEEAIACFHKAIDLDPKHAPAQCNLGMALLRKGQLDGAIDCFRQAIAFNPKYTAAHYNLGITLLATGKVDEAITRFRKVIALEPRNARAHENLGKLLKARGQVDQAIACFRKATQLDPKLTQAHYDLGLLLAGKGEVDQAIASYRKAIALDLKDARVYTSLGAVLCDVKRDYNGAIACFRQAIALDPKHVSAHYNLGIALHRKGQVDETIASFQKAIELDPKHVSAHYSLGNALKDRGSMDEAMACWRRTIELDPKYAEAHCNLGHALASQGRFAESLAAHRRGHELGSKRRGWPYPSARWVRQAETNAAMEAKLPALLKGEFRPRDGKECLALAGVCQAWKFHHAAARLYADAFAADAKLAGDLKAGHRCNAACNAALAAAGQGEDAARLDDRERARLRKQTLDWLRADLALRTRQMKSELPGEAAQARAVLGHWQKDPDLAGLRDKEALDKLPAQEQKAFAQLWADVAATLKKAGSEAK
jgi:tetratricopeptide (TPR) repeat protein/serine/threonine protein kinase